MLRSMSNTSVMVGEPSELRDDISDRPAMEPSACSSGMATLDAMVSGLAPAMRALTEIIGKSICGKGATGKSLYANTPDNTIAMHSRVVVTGRRTNRVSHLMALPAAHWRARDDWPNSAAKAWQTSGK